MCIHENIYAYNFTSVDNIIMIMLHIFLNYSLYFSLLGYPSSPIPPKPCFPSHIIHVNTLECSYLYVLHISYMYAQSLSRVWLFATPQTVAHQILLSMGFSKQEYWSGLPFSTPGELPNPGIESVSPALKAVSLPLSHLGSPVFLVYLYAIIWSHTCMSDIQNM